MTRTYTLRTRGEAKTKTREQILGAAKAEFSAKWFDEVTLQQVADLAKVGIQTVLRHFPTKEALFLSASQGALERADGSRSQQATSGWRESVRILWDYFETHGALVLHYLDQFERNLIFSEITERGRAAHVRWVRQLFGPFLVVDDPGVQLLLDIRTWEFFRHRLGLTRVEGEVALCGLIAKLPPLG